MGLWHVGAFAILDRCPQCASRTLRLVNAPCSQVILPTRCPRQTAQTHYLRLAQMEQGNGQIRIHNRQRLERANSASANSSVRRRSARTSSSIRSRLERHKDSGKTSATRFNSGLRSRSRVWLLSVTLSP